jgi:hypothetical protein
MTPWRFASQSLRLRGSEQGQQLVQALVELHFRNKHTINRKWYQYHSALRAKISTLCDNESAELKGPPMFPVRRIEHVIGP